MRAIETAELTGKKISDLQKQPKNETGQMITYALIATALVGIFVYHYIKEKEGTN